MAAGARAGYPTTVAGCRHVRCVSYTAYSHSAASTGVRLLVNASAVKLKRVSAATLHGRVAGKTKWRGWSGSIELESSGGGSAIIAALFKRKISVGSSRGS